MASNLGYDVLGKYYLAKKTSIELAIDHGFTPDDISFKDITLDDFTRIMKSSSETIDKILSKIYTNANGEKLLIRFVIATGNTTGTEISSGLLDELTAIKGSGFGKLGSPKVNAVLVFDKKLTPPALKVLKADLPFNSQIYYLDELGYNPTHHMFAPESRILTKEEREKFLKGNKINAKQMPKTNINDPICKYYGWPVGSIIMKRVRSILDESDESFHIEFSVVDRIFIS